MEMFVVCVKEGMQESLLSGESPTSTSLNNPYPPRQGMSGVFVVSIFFYDLLHYLFWTGFPICNALSKRGACLELPEGESGCELPPHLSWSERERSQLAGIRLLGLVFCFCFCFFPFPLASAARRGNWNWPMSY